MLFVIVIVPCDKGFRRPCIMGYFVRYYCNGDPGYVTVDWCSTVEEAKDMIADLEKGNPDREYFYEYAEED